MADVQGFTVTGKQMEQPSAPCVPNGRAQPPGIVLTAQRYRSHESGAVAGECGGSGLLMPRAAFEAVNALESVDKASPLNHVLTRTLIAWKVTRGGVATRTEVAARLGRAPSALWTTIERCRAA